jgi:CubicO group peptidase (beta-lactamase class C family)
VKRAAALAALVVLLAGCQAPKREALAPTGDLPPPLVPAMELPAAAVDNAVAQLDRIAKELMESSGIPGMAVAVVHEGKTVYARGFGIKDKRVDDKLANRVGPDTVFQLASLSKSLSATVVAHQVGEGRIDWNTPIASRLPWFTLADPEVTRRVTVSDMFAHRSGLPDHAGDELEDLGYDRRYVLEHLKDLPLMPFRISYAYTNFGLTVGAEAVAAAAGRPWEDLAHDVLYEPLGMTSTSSRFEDYERRKDKAIGHIRIGDGYEPEYTRDADAQSPAGGVSSSVNDMARWMAMVLAQGRNGEDQLIPQDALLPAVSPQIVSSPPSEPAARAGFYGYGFNVNTTSGARTQLSHSGAFELGAGTNFLMIPSADVGIVALTNATPTGVPETLTAEFADLVQFGEVREDWRTLYRQKFEGIDAPVGNLVGKPKPARPAPPPPVDDLVGTYDNDYWGPATVTERDGNLFLTLGPKAEPWPLTHWDGNVFTFSFVSENSPPGSVSAATFDGDRLTLEYFDTNGKGTFTR